MKKLFGIVGLCAVLGTASGTESNGVELLYQRALHLETAKADYDGAIPIYATILSQHAQNAAIAAKALFRQGVCYEKTGKLDLARECAQRLTGEFQAIAKADPDMAKWAERLGGPIDGGSGKQGLAQIELPDHPSKEQVRQHIANVLSGSESRTRFSSNDPQVRQLKRVGSENVDLLVDSLDSDPRSFGKDYFLIEAIKTLANDSNKKTILDGLAIHPSLAEVIVQRGWEQDAKQTLVKELKDAGEYLPTQWIVAVARLKDPATYPLLRNYFIRGSNKHSTYEAIKTLPIGDLAGAVKEAWQASRAQDTQARYMALIAAEHGHIDALEFLAQQWADLPENDEWFANQVRRVFAKITDFTGTGTEAPAWFKTNQEHLKFDPATKKFVIGKSEAPSANTGEVK
jgi:hypothetical protein